MTDAEFWSQEFFDARDAVQVKYEMVRRVRAEGDSVTAAAAAFGYSRPSYYQAAAALDEHGLDGLVPGQAGPARRPQAHRRGVRIRRGAAWPPTPRLRPADLVEPIAARFGVRVHPRSIERALARCRERRPKAADLSTHELRKEDPGPRP